MKITRMKKGYIIRLSDTEMDVLNETVSEGMGSGMWQGENFHMEPEHKRIITEVQTMKRDWMVVTEDRRQESLKNE